MNRIRFKFSVQGMALIVLLISLILAQVMNVKIQSKKMNEIELRSNRLAVSSIVDCRLVVLRDRIEAIAPRKGLIIFSDEDEQVLNLKDGVFVFHLGVEAEKEVYGEIVGEIDRVLSAPSVDRIYGWECEIVSHTFRNGQTSIVFAVRYKMRY